MFCGKRRGRSDSSHLFLCRVHHINACCDSRGLLLRDVDLHNGQANGLARLGYESLYLGGHDSTGLLLVSLLENYSDMYTLHHFEFTLCLSSGYITILFALKAFFYPCAQYHAKLSHTLGTQVMEVSRLTSFCFSRHTFD